MIDRDYLRNFCDESNRIEGLPAASAYELAASLKFLNKADLSIKDLQDYVLSVAGATLREKAGQNVTIGKHTPPKGGPQIRTQLVSLIDRINKGEISAYKAHLEYEHLHPFLDGNGRSGRILWLWQMLQHEYGSSLPFLHLFYYQALDDYHSRTDRSRIMEELVREAQERGDYS